MAEFDDDDYDKLRTFEQPSLGDVDLRRTDCIVSNDVAKLLEMLTDLVQRVEVMEHSIDGIRQHLGNLKPLEPLATPLTSLAKEERDRMADAIAWRRLRRRTKPYRRALLIMATVLVGLIGMLANWAEIVSTWSGGDGD